jgi:hypothetical protein
MSRKKGRQARKKGTPELSPEDAHKIWSEIKDLHIRRWRLGQDFVQSVQGLEPLERAKAWLKYVAENEGPYVAQEAVVYLVSRGHDCTDRIRDIVAAWKLDEKGSLDAYAYEQQECHGKDVSHVEVSDVLGQSLFSLQPFWENHPPQHPSFDATMLRTVEWCSIGGFDHWWQSFARQALEGIFRVGIDPVPAAFYLFSMCRSDYAIQLMHKALDRLLHSIELPDHDQPYPWQRWDEEGPYKIVDNLSYAASIVFGAERLRPYASSTELELVSQAVEVLLTHQDIQGFWRCWADDKGPDIYTTAMAIHALALKRPRGWELAASPARDWLWSVQDESGCWIEFGCDSVHLTVLVLDALELAAGGTKVTFDIATPSRDMDRTRLYVEDIDSFCKVRDVDPAAVSHLLSDEGYLDRSEDFIQTALEQILTVPFHKKDWGGEISDLYTANIVVNGLRTPTAFLLKGRGLKRKVLEIRDCGQNGDQLVRLFDSPAQLFVVQFVGKVSENVIKDVQGKVSERRSRGEPVWYCIMDGQDTARVLHAYGKL